MKKRLYKLLAFALSVCMVVGLMPAMTLTARAEGASVELGDPYKVENADTTFTFPKASVSGEGGWKTMTVSISGTNTKIGFEQADSAHAKGDLKSQFVMWTWEEGKDDDAIATILKSLVFTKGAEEPTVTVELSKGGSSFGNAEADAKITEGTGNYVGHYYMYVPFTDNTNRSWHVAYNAAKGYTFMGMKGYLATISDTTEEAFLRKISTNGAWTGGTSLLQYDKVTKLSDPDELTKNNINLPQNYTNRLGQSTLRGMYYWACGPEHGQTISESLWTKVGGDEPNAYNIPQNKVLDRTYDHLISGSYSYETCVQANRGGSVSNTLNDMAEGNLILTEGDTIKGYFVEFGGYTETPDPGYGGEEAPESAKTEPAVTVSDSTLKGPMQTFTLPEGTVQASGNCLFSQDDAQHKIVIDPEGDGDVTVTLKPTDGQAYDQAKVNAWLESKTTGVTAEVNPDGSVTLTFTQASKYQTSGDMSDLATEGQKSIEAKIDGNIYSTVKDALKAAESSDTVELQMNSGLTAVEGAGLKNGVTLKTKGAEDGDGNSFTSNSDETKVDVTADGKVTVKPGDANADLQKDGTVTVGETEYTAKGETGAKLHITKEGDADKVELTEGSVEVPASKDITVKGKKVTAGEVAITATTNEDGSATVHVDASQTVTIDGVTYTGEADIVIGNDDSVSVKKGTVNLPSSEEGAANGETNVDFGDGKSVHVKNAASEIGKDVTVTVPGDTEGTGKATMSQGSAVTIGPKDDAGKTYTATQNDTELEFDKNGDVTLKKGGVELGTGNAAVKFGGKDITATDGSESGKVKVETTDGEKAAVTVPQGGSVEIGGTTYTNTGDGELELEVDKDGNVTLKTDTVENSKVQVSDGGSLKVGENTYTAKGDATIEAAKEATEGTLTEGTVALGENSKVKTKSAGEEVTVSGTEGLEVTAGGDGENAKVKGTGTVGDSVTVQKGDNTHSYALESGDTAEHEISSEGVIAGLAEELAKGGSTNGSAYGVKRDSAAEGNVYTLTDEDGNITVTADASSKFTYGVQPADTSVGTYEVPEGKDSASLTADQEGNVTLKDGTVKVTPGTEKGKIKVGTNVIETDEATVTTTEDGGADIELGNGKSVTVGENKYTAADDNTKLHMDDEGNVTLESGKVKLAEGTTMTMDGVTYTGEVTVEKTEDGGYKATFTGNTGSVSNNTTTYTPGESGGEATVDAEGNITGTLGTAGGMFTVDSKAYTSENSGKATVDKETGKVTLDSGSIKTPGDGGSVTVSSGEADGAKDYTVEGNDVTVTKGSPSSAKVGEGGTLKVTEDGNEHNYSNAAESGELEVELTKDGPTIKSGTAGVAKGDDINVSGTENKTNVKNTGNDDLKVKSETDGATVTVPKGGSAEFKNGENTNTVTVPNKEDGSDIDVKVGNDGSLTVKPGAGKDVTINGKTYRASDEEGSIKVSPDGTVEITGNVSTYIEKPTNEPVHLGKGETVTFEDASGHNVTVTGGDPDGGYIMVDANGNVTVTDAEGNKLCGQYSNAGDDELKLTISSNEEGSATLTGGTVHVDAGQKITATELDKEYTAGSDGMELKYPSDTDDGVPALTDGSVILEGDAPVKVGDNTYTPQNDNVEITSEGVVGSKEEDAKVKFKGKDEETEKEYLIPAGKTSSPDSENKTLTSPAQQKLTTAESGFGSAGTSVKQGENGDAYFESTGDGGELTLTPNASAVVKDSAENETTFKNAGETDAHLTLDEDGNATLTDGTVKMTGEGAEGKGTSVTVNGNTITSKDATVTAPGKGAGDTEEPGSADVTIPSGGKASIDGKEYSASDGDLTLHVAPNGDVSLKNGKVGLADDSSIKFGDTEITNPASSGSDNVTVEATGDKANVTVPTGEGNSVDIGGDTYTNAGGSDLELEVDTNGDVTLNSGKVTLPDSGDASVKVGDNTVTGNGVTVDKSSDKNTVEIPSGKTATVTDAEGNENKFTAKAEDTKVTLGEGGATLESGSADIGKGTEVTVSGAKVENAGPGDVTVEKTADGGEITIPAGTTATVNGVEVKGPAKVTVDGDGKATVKPEPAGAGKSVTVGGVTYTDTSEDGSGKVEISKDGTVKAENMSAAIEKLPVEGLVVPAGQTLTYKAGGKDVTLKGGASDSKIDIAANGDITMESGNLTIKGDVTTKKAADESEATWQYVGDVTLKLTDEDGKAVEGVDESKVKVTGKDAKGVEIIVDPSQIEVNPDGTVTLKDVPYGSYTVEVEGATGKKTTTTVTVNGASTTSSMTVDTNLTVETEVTGSAAVKPSAAENLESLVDSSDRQEAAEATSSAEVKIELKVDTADGAGGEKTAIDTIKGDVNIEANAYVDVTVEKTVTIDGDSEGPEEIHNTPSLITMRFPVDSKILGSKTINSDNADCIQVFRYHDGSAAKMRKVSPSAGKTANFECYYIEVSPDSDSSITVVVKANKFSVYAFGVADSAILPQDPSTGGGGGVVAYPVTLPESVDNGTVSANYSSAAPGVTVTLTVTPDDGYTMGSITITDRNGNIIPVTDNGDGTYSFRMPSGGVEVSISFKLSHCDGGDDCPSRAFPDLDVTAWYHEYTDYVIETKLMQGSGGLFKPNGTLTRAEMVTVLWNMNGRGVVNYLMTYGDVSEEDWYAEAIRWATSEGVVGGYDNGNFGPNDKITREQMAKMLYNYEKKYGDGGFTGAWMFPLPFADTAKINDWAYEAVAWCYMNGVINGKDGNVFDPAGNALRCELAKVLTVYNQIDD